MTTYLFDFDGTLVDSAALHCRAFEQVLEAERPALLQDFEYEAFRGRATGDVFRTLGVTDLASNERFTKLKQMCYQKAVRAGQLRVLPGAREVLAALSTAGNPIYLVTSGSRPSVELALHATGLTGFFDGIVTASDVPRGKPAPDLYLEALRLFALKAEDCLAVEDAPSGVEAAGAAGIDVVMVDPLSGPECFLAFIRPQSTWAVIPAAGRGSRLGLADRPKILAPVDEATGTTIWSILEAKVSPVTDRIQVVLSPSGSAFFAGEAVDVAIQDAPLGMGDAIFCGSSGWNADRILIVWGDQVNLSRATIERTLRTHSLAPPGQPAFVLPRIWTEAPYVQYDFDDAGALLRVRQTREGDTTDQAGWSDAGVFCLSTAGLTKPLAGIPWRRGGARKADG